MTMSSKEKIKSCISIAVYTIPIISKQLHGDKQENNRVNVVKFNRYQTN